MARPPISFLICPDCRQELKSSALPSCVGSCPQCKREFSCDRGVTDMAPSEVPPLTKQTVSQFGTSWQIHDHLADFQHQQFLDWVAPLGPEDFAGQSILEAGSGKGRHTLIMSGFKPDHLLTIDLSDAILLAAENTKDFPQTYCIRGDLLRLPILDESISLVVCLGVLHHLEDPFGGLKELWSKLKPGRHFLPLGLRPRGQRMGRLLVRPAPQEPDVQDSDKMAEALAPALDADAVHSPQDPLWPGHQARDAPGILAPLLQLPWIHI